MKKNINSIQDLICHGLIDTGSGQELAPVVANYKLAISADLLDLIDKSDPQDPIYRQFVPDIRELNAKPHEIFDPIGDNAHTPVKGLVHRYSDRVLLKLTNNCPIYCRFCFRREMVGKPQSGILNDNELSKIAEYLKSHSEIKEVILTGGDPLILPPNYLLKISLILRDIPSVEKLRVHSRVLCAVPKLINKKLIEVLAQSQKQIRIALHINHANEISATAEEKARLLLDNNIELLSQSVLLVGVNDNAEVLARLYNKFAQIGIKPYYLHHPDLARGTSHFQLDFEAGMAIFAQLGKLLPKNKMPRYVIDIPSGFGKVDVNSDNITLLSDDTYQIEDRFGARHAYP